MSVVVYRGDNFHVRSQAWLKQPQFICYTTDRRRLWNKCLEFIQVRLNPNFTILICCAVDLQLIAYSVLQQVCNKSRPVEFEF